MVGIGQVEEFWISEFRIQHCLLAPDPHPPEEDGVLVRRYSLTSGATAVECNAADDAIASARDIESDKDSFHPKDPVHLSDLFFVLDTVSTCGQHWV